PPRDVELTVLVKLLVSRTQRLEICNSLVELRCVERHDRCPLVKARSSRAPPRRSRSIAFDCDQACDVNPTTSRNREFGGIRAMMPEFSAIYSPSSIFAGSEPAIRAGAT